MHYLWHGSRTGAIRRRAAGGNQGWEREDEWLQSPMLIWGLNILNGKVPERLWTTLSMAAKSHAVMLSWDVNHSFLCADHPRWTCQLSASHLGVSLISYCCFNKVFLLKWLLFYFLMAPKCKSGDVGNFYMPKRKPWSISLKERSKIT